MTQYKCTTRFKGDCPYAIPQIKSTKYACKAPGHCKYKKEWIKKTEEGER